ncbi:MAG: SDR family NAD(P)-dependent oxidoreductase [Thiotrichaceae bacterium]
MDVKEKKRVILITGASGGIGAALAKLYSQPGVTLGLLGRNMNKLESVANLCKEKGAVAIPVSIDVTDTSKLQQWIVDFNSKHPVDLLIANAGVTSSIGSNGEAESWDAIKDVLDVNLHGVIATIYPLIEPMRKRGEGQVAIVSSLAAYRGLPITPSYCASKAGIKVYGEALRGWLAKEGVKVSVICPGFVKSAMSDQFAGDKPFLMTAEKAARIIKKGLDNNKARIAFPFPLNFGTWLLTLLPASFADYILGLLSYGAKRKEDK